MLAAQHAAGAGNTRLHLVGNEQHIVLVAQVVAGLHISVVGHKHTRLALNRLSDEGTNLVALLVEHLLQGLRIIIRYAYEARSERSVLCIRAGVVAHGDDRYGSAVEVAVAANHLDLVVGNAFLHGAPAAGQLQSSLHALGTRVHRQYAVVTEILVHELLVFAECVVIESP